jgi:hypothetical protein
VTSRKNQDIRKFAPVGERTFLLSVGRSDRATSYSFSKTTWIGLWTLIISVTYRCYVLIVPFRIPVVKHYRNREKDIEPKLENLKVWPGHETVYLHMFGLRWSPLPKTRRGSTDHQADLAKFVGLNCSESHNQIERLRSVGPFACHSPTGTLASFQSCSPWVV